MAAWAALADSQAELEAALASGEWRSVVATVDHVLLRETMKLSAEQVAALNEWATIYRVRRTRQTEEDGAPEAPTPTRGRISINYSRTRISPAVRGCTTRSDSAVYRPDRTLLKKLFAVPIEQGHAENQQSGRLAGALDVYLAHELRRAGFDTDVVYPRRVASRGSCRPRLWVWNEPWRGWRLPLRRQTCPATLRSVRLLVSATRRCRVPRMRAFSGASIYRKQVDVAVSAWDTGPVLLISGKTQVKSYANNTNNRYEEAIGEAINLRDRYPMTALGYAFLRPRHDHQFPGLRASVRPTAPAPPARRPVRRDDAVDCQLD